MRLSFGAYNLETLPPPQNKSEALAKHFFLMVI